MQKEERCKCGPESAGAERDPERPPCGTTYKKTWVPRTRLLLSHGEQQGLELSDLTQVQRIQSKKKKKRELLWMQSVCHAHGQKTELRLDYYKPSSSSGFPFFILANGPTPQRSGILSGTSRLISNLCVRKQDRRKPLRVLPHRLVRRVGRVRRDGSKPGSRAGRKHVRKTETHSQHDEGVTFKR